MPTGNRSYHEIERKQRKRIHKRANKVGQIDKKRRRRAKDMMMSRKLKGELQT